MKNFLFVIGLAVFCAIPAYAELTVDDTVSGTYLKNHGYSKSSINVVNKKIAEVNGEEYKKPIEHEFYETPVAKYVRRFFMYIDPALDSETFSNDHNINTTTKWSDL